MLVHDEKVIIDIATTAMTLPFAIKSIKVYIEATVLEMSERAGDPVFISPVYNEIFIDYLPNQEVYLPVFFPWESN